MTMYENFIQDFPKRCFELMDEEDWEQRDREVTVSLMVASTAFLVPYERLKPLKGPIPHPSKDRTKHDKVTTALEKLLREPFLSSSFCGKSQRSWRNCERNWLAGDVMDWSQNAIPMEANISVRDVLTVIRNGLAHGSVYVNGGIDHDKNRSFIKELVFVSEKREDSVVVGYRFIVVTPSDFRLFLKNWFRLIIQQGESQKEFTKQALLTLELSAEAA